MKVTDGKQLLRDCERQLRGLAAEAVADGDYEAALEITKYARGVSALITGDEHYTLESNTRSNNGSPDFQIKASEAKKRPRRRVNKKLGKETYPRFARSKDNLVKVGWSKKDKSEYVHRAPRQVIDSLVSRLLELHVGRSEAFTTEDIFPLYDESNGTEIPAYQSYLALAWLRSVGLITQHGRQGYTVKKTESPLTVVTENWNNLPKHRK